MNSETTSLLVLTNKTKTGTRVFHSPKLRIRQPKTDPNCWKKAAACSQQMPTIFLFGSNFMMVITNITNSVRFKMIQGHCIQDVENDKPLCDSIGTCRIGTRIFNPHLGTPVFAAYLANCSVGKHYFLLLASFLNLCWSNRHLLPSGKRLHNSGKSQFSMGKSTISMVIFNIAMLVITRGYVKRFSGEIPGFGCCPQKRCQGSSMWKAKLQHETNKANIGFISGFVISEILVGEFPIHIIYIHNIYIYI